MSLWVNGIVAARDHMPYVVLSKDENTVAQLSIAEAFNLARDLIQAAARTEADAMLLRFFSKQGYPTGAGAALMVEFRDFRAEMDKEDPRIGHDYNDYDDGGNRKEGS